MAIINIRAAKGDKVFPTPSGVTPTAVKVNGSSVLYTFAAGNVTLASACNQGDSVEISHPTPLPELEKLDQRLDVVEDELSDGIVGQKGDKGDKGDKGNQGPPGSEGAILPVTMAGLSGYTVDAWRTAFLLAGYNSFGDLGMLAPMREITASQAATSKNNPRQDATGRWFELNTTDEARPGWFGARYDIVTDDSDAHQKAFDSDAKVIRLHSGTTNVKLLNTPDEKRVVGEGTTSLRPTSVCSYVIRMGAGCTLERMSVNGNLVATEGVRVDGPVCHIERVYTTYCSKGFHNTALATAVTWTNTRTANNTYGVYSSGGWNNSSMVGHQSLGGDTYGLYMTYTGDPNLDQPQSVRLTQCLFFGNVFGVWCEKNVFAFVIDSSVVDGCTNQAVRFGPDSANIRILNSFLSASGVVVDIGEGSNDVAIENNTGISNGVISILLRATTTKRVTHCRIKGNTLGPTLDTAQGAAGPTILVNSPDDISVIENNKFSPFIQGPSAIPLVAVQSDYTGGPIGNMAVINNEFPSGASSNAVTDYKTVCSKNVNWKTKAEGIATIAAGQTLVIVPHGLVRPPSSITKLFARGNTGIGALSVDNLAFDPVNIVIRTAVAPTVDTVIDWGVAAD